MVGLDIADNEGEQDFSFYRDVEDNLGSKKIIDKVVNNDLSVPKFLITSLLILFLLFLINYHYPL